MKTIIHVHQQKIRSNIKKAIEGEKLEPPVIIKYGKKTYHVERINFFDDNGNLIMVLNYSPDKPLSCGARLWLETTPTAVVDNTCCRNGINEMSVWLNPS